MEILSNESLTSVVDLSLNGRARASIRFRGTCTPDPVHDPFAPTYCWQRQHMVCFEYIKVKGISFFFYLQHLLPTPGGMITCTDHRGLAPFLPMHCPIELHIAEYCLFAATNGDWLRRCSLRIQNSAAST